MKPSIGSRGVLYKSGVYARKALCLTPGGLSCALPVGRAEGRVIDPDRMREVSSLSGRSLVKRRLKGILGGRKQIAEEGCMDEVGTRPAYRKSR